MAITRYGDTVRIHYTGRLRDGDVIFSTLESEPIQFQVGRGEVIPGLEKTVLGMKPGETKEATLQPVDAFGRQRRELIIEMGRDKLPVTIDPAAGQQIVVNYKDDQSLIFTVTEVTPSEVKLDANHPLAGKEVIVDVELLEILRN